MKLAKPCKYCGVDIDTGNTAYSADVVHTECLRMHNAGVMQRAEVKAFADAREWKFRQDAGVED